MIKIKNIFDAALHYDSITEGWRYILGENFHYGYFKTPEDDLSTATNNLIDELALLYDLKPETNILDAGCGIGTPAIYLNEKFGSYITGISTSKKGIDLAMSRIKRGKDKRRIHFMVADMTDTGLPDESFDVIWILESSHIIRNKRSLFDEGYRLLKPGGSILLADLMRGKKFNFFMKLRNIFKLINNVITFGKGNVERPERYTELLRQAGFKNIFSKNIRKETEPTLNGWRENILKNRQYLVKEFNEREIDGFEKSIETLKTFFKEEFYCYYLFRADK